MKKTPLFEEHVRLGARMVDFAGWQMPIQYAGIIEEHEAVRNHVGIFDVSHMGEIEVSGSRALEFCQMISCNDVSRLKPGKIQYSAILNEQGGVIDDCTIYQMSESTYLFVVNASRKDDVFAWFKKHQLPDTEIVDLSDRYGLLALQGKKGEALLSSVVGRDLSTVRYYEFSILQFDSQPVIVSRTGYSGEDGFEIYVPIETTLNLWKTLLKAGSSANIMPIGLGARDTLRLEMGYMLYGQDMNETVTALEAGLSWIVKFDKGNFVGKNALLHQKSSGLSRRIRGLLMEEKAIPRPHYEVFQSETKIGEITSGTFSPTLKCGVALALLHDEIGLGDQVHVQIRKNRCLAKVVKPPFVPGSVKK